MGNQGFLPLKKSKIDQGLHFEQSYGTQNSLNLQFVTNEVKIIDNELIPSELFLAPFKLFLVYQESISFSSFSSLILFFDLLFHLARCRKQFYIFYQHTIRRISQMPCRCPWVHLSPSSTIQPFHFYNFQDRFTLFESHEYRTIGSAMSVNFLKNAEKKRDRSRGLVVSNSSTRRDEKYRQIKSIRFFFPLPSHLTETNHLTETLKFYHTNPKGRRYSLSITIEMVSVVIGPYVYVYVHPSIPDSFPLRDVIQEQLSTKLRKFIARHSF
jgi:hypothetical protein